MFEISEELKNLYRTDYFPARDTQLKKDLKLYFPELDMTITNENIFTESMKLSESVCSDTDLTLGGCEAAEFAITVAGIGDEVIGKVMIVTQTVDSQYDMPLGIYRVKSARKKDDLDFKEILSYDSITDTDVDVSAWYNTLTWPQTVKGMRKSLLNYLGILYEEQDLTNDTVSLEKTISPSQLLGRTVLKKLCEINAGFGHIGRDGNFKVVQLSGLGLYPSETLYPAEDLFPAESSEYITSGYIKTSFEEYIVQPITAITIREDDEDTGATEGTLENPYVISDNFLLYGKSSAELHTIAANILKQVKNKYYRPHNTTMIGLPYMEAGDTVTIITGNEAIETFIIQRELSGIQVLRDNIKATGNHKRSQTVSANDEIQQLKGKALRIQKNVDQLSINMTDMEEGLQSQITQTAGQLQTQITDNKNSLQSQITQTAGMLQTQITDNYSSLSSTFTQTASSLQTQITDNKSNANSQISQLSSSIDFKVSKGDVSSQISIESGQVTFNSNRLIVNSNNFQLDSAGNATFKGNVQGATITGGTITGTTITGVQIDATFVRCSQNGNGTVVSPGGITIAGGGLIIDGQSPSMPGHIHTTGTSINASTDGSGGISFANNLSAAGYQWVNTNFQRVSSSDIRLKKNYRTLKELPLSLYLDIKPYLYEFKIKDYGEGVRMGFMAQQIEQAFEEYGLDPFSYNLVQKRDPRENTDEDQYVFLDGKVHYINYENMHAWTAHVLQQVVEKVFPEVITSES